MKTTPPISLQDAQGLVFGVVVAGLAMVVLPLDLAIWPLISGVVLNAIIAWNFHISQARLAA